MINENELKQTVVTKLIYYRKANNLTQLQLAEKLNYSDKSISKWERGESIPDLLVLSTLADLYGVTLNDLTTNKSIVKPKPKKARALITIISFATVWLVATLAYVILKLLLPSFTQAWLAFIFAIPISMIVLIVFSKLWGNRLQTFFAISILYWSVPVCVYLSVSYERLWLIFISIIPLQIITFLFFILSKEVNKSN